MLPPVICLTNGKVHVCAPFCSRHPFCIFLKHWPSYFDIFLYESFAMPFVYTYILTEVVSENHYLIVELYMFVEL